MIWFYERYFRGGCVHIACVVCFSTAILRTTRWLLWGSMVLVPCLPLMHKSLQDIRTEPGNSVQSCMTAHSLHIQYCPLVSSCHTLCSFYLRLPLCIDSLLFLCTLVQTLFSPYMTQCCSGWSIQHYQDSTVLTDSAFLQRHDSCCGKF